MIMNPTIDEALVEFETVNDRDLVFSDAEMDALDALLNPPCPACNGIGETEEADVDEDLYHTTGLVRGVCYLETCHVCHGSGVDMDAILGTDPH